ncbi:unnamed protein product [Miscanthus lutarioriparius]|uniref:3'-5' exonuclease domain-containing protein n=1 Tax=Miscanthus lutarioriparius TaxID=422564 RepID=A0A811SF02_9POAL|nr:unnamed protein product [Miscanthus lutarioriparius]
MERWIAEILSVHRPGGIGYNITVGLDVEWRPSYLADQNPVATLQLCVERSCLIFQLLHADYLPGALAEFLGVCGIRFFGVGVEADAERLGDDHGLQVANTVDLRGHATGRMNRPDLCQAGLHTLVHAVMGVDLVKPQRIRIEL